MKDNPASLLFFFFFLPKKTFKPQLYCNSISWCDKDTVQKNTLLLCKLLKVYFHKAHQKRFKCIFYYVSICWKVTHEVYCWKNGTTAVDSFQASLNDGKVNLCEVWTKFSQPKNCSSRISLSQRQLTLCVTCAHCKPSLCSV